MSNFEIYLARAQGNHKTEIETSHFLNENFRNYMEKVFYMEELTTASEKTGTSSNPAVAVDNVNKKVDLSTLLPKTLIDINILPNSDKIIFTFYKDSKQYEAKLEGSEANVNFKSLKYTTAKEKTIKEQEVTSFKQISEILKANNIAASVRSSQDSFIIGIKNDINFRNCLNKALKLAYSKLVVGDGFETALGFESNPETIYCGNGIKTREMEITSLNKEENSSKFSLSIKTLLTQKAPISNKADL